MNCNGHEWNKSWRHRRTQMLESRAKTPQNAEETQQFRQHQRRETDLILGQDPSSEEVFHSETNLHCWHVSVGGQGETWQNNIKIWDTQGSQTEPVFQDGNVTLRGDSFQVRWGKFKGDVWDIFHTHTHTCGTHCQEWVLEADQICTWPCMEKGHRSHADRGK